MALVRPAAVGLTVGTLMVLAESFMVAGQELTRWAIGHLTHSAVSPWIVTVVRWIIFLVLLWAILTFIYNGLARPRPHFRWLTPGSAVVTVTWVLLSLGFSFYTAHWATYNTLYGSLGAVILLMIYLNLLSYALLIGGAINAFTLARDAPKDESTP
jgi:membrane protein